MFMVLTALFCALAMSACSQLPPSSNPAPQDVMPARVEPQSFCRRNADTDPCIPHADDRLRALFAKIRERRAAHFNWVDMQARYGDTDYWRYPDAKGDGNCVSFVLAMSKDLVAAGIPWEAQAMVVVIQPGTGIEHALLLLRTDAGTWAAEQTRVMTWDQAKRIYKPVRMSQFGKSFIDQWVVL